MEKDDQDVEVTTRDMNGDGLVDIIWGVSESDWRVYFNTGSHFRQYGNWTPPGLNDDDIVEIEDHNDDEEANDTRRDLMDINGDGLPDIVHAQDSLNNMWYVYLNRGDRFLQRMAWPFAMNTKYVRDVTYDGDRKSSIKRDMLDMNGDGLPDIVKRESGSYWSVYLNQSKAADLMTRVTDTLGAKITVTYTSSMNYAHTRLPFNYWVVESLVTDNGMAEGNPHKNVAATAFSYANGLYDFPSREFRGFGQVTENRADGSKMLHYFHQDEARKGKEFRTELKNAGDAPFSKSESTWTSTSPASGVLFPKLDASSDYTFDGIWENPRQVRTEFQNYDAYGNVQTEVRRGDVSTSADDFTENREFDYNLSRWILDRVKQSYVTDASGTKLREKWMTYDGDGNLKTEEAWLNPGTNAITYYDYDTFGNRTKITDPGTHVSTVLYDTVLNTFPIKTWNPKNQLTARSFYLSNGQVLTETDPNGYTTEFRYDVFGRKIKEFRQYDSEASPTVKIDYAIDGTAPEHVKTARKENSSGTTLDTFQIIDGFANLIQTRTESENAGQQIVSDVYYDKMGRVVRQSNPYFASLTAGYGTPNTGIPATVYEYDTGGRPVTVVKPDETRIRRFFDHWKVTEEDENGHRTAYWFDAYQSLVQVQENNRGESYYTKYQYSPIGELVRITDHLQNTTTIAYDSLGRKISMSDPDMGNWSYGYDKVGNLVSQKDAKGTETVIRYDELNRKILVDYPGDTDITFTYDTNTIGTLSKVDDSAGSVTYSYDRRLRKISESRKIDDHTWTTSWSYDSLDRVISMTYPNGESLSFEFNTQGTLNSIPGILGNMDYNAAGQTVQKMFLNGLTTTYTYDAKNSRLTGMQTPGIQDFRYSYDSVGNVLSLQDNMTGRTENFTYDDLDRLLSAGDSAYSASYVYNAIGNMQAEITNTEAMVQMSFEYSYGKNAGPHAVTAMEVSKPIILSFYIQDNAEYVVSRNTTLNISAFGFPTHYMASESSTFQGAVWQTFSNSPPFTLSTGFGEKKVYVKLKNDRGESDVRSDTIDYLLDTDGDGMPDKYDEDDDNDGMTDVWENTYGLNPLNASDAGADKDGDTVTNLQEFRYGGSPLKADTDGDGWSDYEEMFVRRTDPGKADTDGDGINDPLDTDPQGQAQAPQSENYMLLSGTFDMGGDQRKDSAKLLQDRIGGIISKTLTASDSVITGTAGTIGPKGGELVFYQGQLVIHFPAGAVSEEITVTAIKINTLYPPNEGFQMMGTPFRILAADKQGNSITSFSKPVLITMEYDLEWLGEMDEDDLRINYYDMDTGKWISLTSTVDTENKTVTTSSTHFSEYGIFGQIPQEDSDKDGLPDYWEINYFGDLSHDGNQDGDRDGLTDRQEYLNNTNPALYDTDEDGLSDGLELEYQYNPLWQDAFGDVDANHELDLKDAIIVLKICAGITDEEYQLTGDIDGDKKVGIAEAIYILQAVSELVK